MHEIHEKILVKYIFLLELIISTNNLFWIKQPFTNSEHNDYELLHILLKMQKVKFLAMLKVLRDIKHSTLFTLFLSTRCVKFPL